MKTETHIEYEFKLTRHHAEIGGVGTHMWKAKMKWNNGSEGLECCVSMGDLPDDYGEEAFKKCVQEMLRKKGF